MTEYFSAFPYTTFNDTKLKDVTIRLDFLDRIKDNISLFEYYVVKDGERPEDVALLAYGDPNLYWVILYLNDIVDVFHDWVLTQQQVYDYAVRKYGVENLQAAHHYETTEDSELGEGVWASLGTQSIVPVSNLTYEQELNEEKRKIKILKNKFISQVIAEYQRELRGIT